MQARFAAIGAGALVFFAAGSAVAADAPAGLSLTIYANNQALVQDVRAIVFNGGRQKIEFRNVSAQIRPETASLAATDMQVVEQNFCS